MVGLGVLTAGLATVVLFRQVSFYREPAQVEAREQQLEKEEEEATIRADEVRWLNRVLASLGLPPPSSDDSKPPRFELRGPGVVLVASMLTLAAVGPWVALGKWWLVASLGSAIILGAGLWRIASLAESRFTWYGLAVFISVPLFGTLDDDGSQHRRPAGSADGADPQHRWPRRSDPGALRHRSRRTASTSPRSQRKAARNELSPHSGRLALGAEESEVVAMTVGPSQDVDDAADTALEMSYALTPARPRAIGEAGGHRGGA